MPRAKPPRWESRCHAPSPPTTRAPFSRRPIDLSTNKTWRNRMKADRIATGIAAALFLASPAFAQMQKVGDPPEASNMRLTGYSDLQARSAYQPTIHHQGDRWIAYIGHHGGTQEIPKPVNALTGQ